MNIDSQLEVVSAKLFSHWCEAKKAGSSDPESELDYFGASVAISAMNDISFSEVNSILHFNVDQLMLTYNGDNTPC